MKKKKSKNIRQEVAKKLAHEMLINKRNVTIESKKDKSKRRPKHKKDYSEEN
jgi:hypothetical protein